MFRSAAFVPLALAGALSSLSVGEVIAADRALLIGVGDYRNKQVGDLPGIDLDIDIMRRVAKRLGFAESDTRVLLDADATLGRVRRSMEEWLIDDVSADDRVLIYFSGHGAQVRDMNGDEADGLDEVLLMHEFASNGTDEPLAGALVDDRFYQLLAQIPANDVLLVVDACNSGSGYKNIGGSLLGVERGVVKTSRSHELLLSGGESFTAVDKNVDVQFAALMAADDHEYAIATEQGSLFTLGLEKAIEEAAAAGQAPTPRDIVVRTTDFIREVSAANSTTVFTPQLGGNERLANKPLTLVSGNPLMDQLAAAVASHPPLKVDANKKDYPIGDTSLRVMVDVPDAGYLNIVTVDPAGDAVVLFPNGFDRDNRVEGGVLAVPTPAMNFDLTANGPVGEHLVAALWTAEPLDLYAGGFGKRDASGELLADFAGLNAGGTRSFIATARENDAEVRAGAVTLRMTP